MNFRSVQSNSHSQQSSKRPQTLRLIRYADDQHPIFNFDKLAGNSSGAHSTELLDSVPKKSGVLNSWKEIATYVGRGVRTVQRWESELQLPVHRPRGKNHSAVVAFPKELDRWLRSTPSQTGNKDTGRALLEIAGDLQTLALQLVATANSQTRPEGEKLVEAASTIVKRLALLMNGSSDAHAAKKFCGGGI
jgi:hypothetical protein